MRCFDLSGSAPLEEFEIIRLDVDIQCNGLQHQSKVLFGALVAVSIHPLDGVSKLSDFGQNMCGRSRLEKSH